MLLVADIHLTDTPDEAYRWTVFDRIMEYGRAHDGASLRILGDLADRKDRHSGALTNAIMDKMQELAGIFDEIIIIKGNHDDPLVGKPFWNILSKLDRVSFLDKVTYFKNTGELFLPYTRDFSSWDFSKYSDAKVIFMHDTVTNAYIHHRKYTNDKMPPLPKDIPIYAGDIHYPQTINGNFTYVGAPHPVRFGDDHPCRMLEIDDHTFQITDEIKLPAIEKRIIEIQSLDGLEDVQVEHGDQVRVRLKLAASRVSQWAEDERAVMEWAELNQVKVASVEAMVETGPKTEFDGRFLDDDYAIFQEFCVAEGLTGDVKDAGLALLNGK